MATDMLSVINVCDVRALREQVLGQATGEVEVEDGEYKGANNYIDYRKARTSVDPGAAAALSFSMGRSRMI